MRQAPKELVDGRYRLVGELGRGGMGAVYRAREEATGREVALKLLPSSHLAERQRERFLREGQASASLHHPGIVRVHAFGEWNARPFLVYEMVPGARTLDEVFEALGREERVVMLIEVARALGYAHARGIIHRDVKPGNVLVDSYGHPRVTDFGLALSADEHDRLTRTGELVGTPSYMAPEQLTGQVGGETPATDVWALGVILYEALTDELPYGGDNLIQLAGAISEGKTTPPRKLDRDISPGLEAVCLRALQADPARRFPDAAAFAAALASPEDHLPRRRGVLLAGALVLGVALGAGVLWATLGNPAASTQGDTPRGAPGPGGEAPSSAGGQELPDLEAIKELEPAAVQLEALEQWLGRAAADAPGRVEAEALRRQLRFDVPLARVEGLPTMRGAVFVDEDTLCVATTPEPLLWSLKQGALQSEGGVLGQRRVQILARRGSALCDVVIPSEGEKPARIVRERDLHEVFRKPGLTLDFRRERDVLLGGSLAQTAISVQRRLPSVVSRPLGDRTLFASVDESSGLRIDLISHRPGEDVRSLATLGIDGKELIAIELSPGGRYLALTLEDPSELWLVDAQSGERLWKNFPGRTTNCLAFSPDEGRLAVGTASEMIMLFDLPGDGKHPTHLQRAERGPYDDLAPRAHAATVRDLVFSTDGRTLASCARKVSGKPEFNELRCWDVASGEDLGEWFRRGLPASPNWLAVSPSGRCLAVGGATGWFEVRRFVPAER